VRSAVLVSLTTMCARAKAADETAVGNSTVDVLLRDKRQHDRTGHVARRHAECGLHFISQLAVRCASLFSIGFHAVAILCKHKYHVRAHVTISLTCFCICSSDTLSYQVYRRFFVSASRSMIAAGGFCRKKRTAKSPRIFAHASASYRRE
jgi:hypothetical protein